MTIAIAQMKLVPGSPADNTAAMLQQIEQARQKKAQLIIFPEMAISGLLIGDLAHNKAFIRECENCAAQVIAASTDIMVVYGNLELREGLVYNSVFLACNGENGRLDAPVGRDFIRGSYSCFAPCDEYQAYNLTVDGKSLLFGFMLGDWRGCAMPYTINDVDVLVNLSQKPLSLGAEESQPRLAGRQYISVNSFGLQNSGKTNYLFGGGSCYYDGEGQLIARAKQLSDGLYLWTRNGGEISSALDDDELLGEALVLGVREFTSQIGAKRAVIGISGGIDSALAAGVYTRALGAENVYLVSMPSCFNSDATKSLGKAMAKGLGTNFAEIPIQDSYTALREQLSSIPFIRADGSEQYLEFSSAVLENMQARERGRILAAVAASVGGIFTCNGNKTELSVGYATFYGDLAGAFAAQADLWKFQVYQASRYFQRLYPEAPFDKIAAIRPSAELSEAQDVTKGLGDPLTYDYHDYLLRFWMEGDYDLSATLALYQSGKLAEKIGCAPELIDRTFTQAADFVADCCRWWKQYRGISIAKRIQAPPLLALSRVPFGEEKPQSQGHPYISCRAEELICQLTEQ